jgi:hypothetical protein
MASIDMTVLGKFLETASSGYVQMEYAPVTNRWRLWCRHCDATFTIIDAATLADDYNKLGLLPSVIMTFAKAHRHSPEERAVIAAKLDVAKQEAQEKLQGLLKDMNFKNPAAVVKELSSTTCNECGETCPCSQHGFGFAKYTRTNIMKQGRRFRQ